MPFELVENYTPGATIKVVGIGGGGGNAVGQMVESSIEGVEFICINTDSQALRNFTGKSVLQIGSSVTKGLGAGANPEVGRQSALEDRERISEMLSGSDMVFLTAGMGGGTGTGAAPVIAQTAKEMGILTVAVVTKPFPFEGQRRLAVAQQGIDELGHHVDSLITIPNAKLLSVLGAEISLLNAFKAANQVLSGAVQGIAELITRPGLINVDFADVRTVMSEMGMAMMGTGESSGDNRAIEAAEKAVSSPLLEDISIHGARGVLINVTASPDVTLQEVNEAAELIHAEAHEDANIIWGMVIDDQVEDKVRVTVIATGFGDALEDATTVSMASVSSAQQPVAPAESSMGSESELPAFARKNKEGSGEVVKLKKLSVLSSSEDEEKYEIPTFLRKQAD